MKLYKFIEKAVTPFLLIEGLTGRPTPFNIKVNMAWLGHVNNVLEVEIKESKENLGWLYSDICLLYFIHKNQLYELSLPELKEKVVSELMKEKKFTERPEINCLYRSDDARVITWVAIEDVLAMAKRVVINE